MKFVILFTFFLLASVVNAFEIVSPGNITACSPLTVQYNTTGGRAPFSLTFYEGDASDSVITAFTDISGTSYTWDTVTIPAGIEVVIRLGDSLGMVRYTSVITVSRGSSDDCLGNLTSTPVIPSFTTSRSFSTTLASGNLPPFITSPPPSTPPSIFTTNPSPTGVTNATQPTATGDGIANAAGLFTIGAISVVVGAFLT